MLKVTEIAFSCYPVMDMVRARKFYEGVLGLKPAMVVGETGGMQWTEYDIGPGTLAIGAGVPGWNPRSDGCSVGLEMEDFDAAIAAHALAVGGVLVTANLDHLARVPGLRVQDWCRAAPSP